MRQRSLKIIVVLFFGGWPVFLQGQELFKKSAGTYWLSLRGNENELSKRRLLTAKNEILLPKGSFIIDYTIHSRKSSFWLGEKEPNYFFYNLFFTRYKISYNKLEEIDHNFFRLAKAYHHHMPGFFCQKELQLDKITPVNFRFRLGSLDYVNWMEQKPNAIKPRF